MSELSKKRPEFRNINAFKDLTTYRLPVAGWVSILHRISGLMMFALLPFIVWIFDQSVTSEMTHEHLTSAFATGTGMYAGWFLKLASLGLIWAFLHHLIAGLRHLYMDRSHKVDKSFGKSSAISVLVISVGLTVLLGAKLFGIY
jgi:succinate dehydrogenase / fumarate reductase, cytochrome b subunit